MLKHQLGALGMGQSALPLPKNVGYGGNMANSVRNNALNMTGYKKDSERRNSQNIGNI